MLNVVLYQPEIPQNTGNIVRTCAATGAALHLIRPFGFSFEDKYLKRAGLDYWDLASVSIYDDWHDFISRVKGVFIYASTKSGACYTDISYPQDCFIIFGPESRGLPEDLLIKNYSQAVRVPMREGVRSLNVANTVAILLYECLRQHGFTGLLSKGTLPR